MHHWGEGSGKAVDEASGSTKKIGNIVTEVSEEAFDISNNVVAFGAGNVKDVASSGEDQLQMQVSLGVTVNLDQVAR